MPLLSGRCGPSFLSCTYHTTLLQTRKFFQQKQNCNISIISRCLSDHHKILQTTMMLFSSSPICTEPYQTCCRRDFLSLFSQFLHHTFVESPRIVSSTWCDFTWHIVGNKRCFETQNSTHQLEVDDFYLYLTHEDHHLCLILPHHLIQPSNYWRQKKNRIAIILINYLLAKNPQRLFFFFFMSRQPTQPPSSKFNISNFLFTASFLFSFGGCCKNSGDTTPTGN